ncbi:hypothetical protein EYB26_009614 [Talaromyces marneffei]|uniref:uncharacterized protein n=1 Tax=Talaromyces marneffei TaxID=37727 RepID=UPI0012AA14D9|nr:uncharacterized protein EYB26_009614 [Talaromyces marneffei]QGA21900.1 hypothetical protein EYB26_009614 [Talaromyces marneffei]
MFESLASLNTDTWASSSQAYLDDESVLALEYQANPYQIDTHEMSGRWHNVCRGITDILSNQPISDTARFPGLPFGIHVWDPPKRVLHFQEA